MSSAKVNWITGLESPCKMLTGSTSQDVEEKVLFRLREARSPIRLYGEAVALYILNQAIFIFIVYMPVLESKSAASILFVSCLLLAC